MSEKSYSPANDLRSIDAAVIRIVRAKLAAGVPLTLPVVSNSMAPLLVRGDTIEVEPLETRAPERGAVVIFRKRGKFFVHRLERISGDTCLTRGDNRSQHDYPIPKAWIVGTLRARIRDGERIDFRPTMLSPESPRDRRRIFVRRLRLACVHRLADAVVRACGRPLVRAGAVRIYQYTRDSLPARLQQSLHATFYLKGSAALDEIEPGVSDIDPLVVHPDIELQRAPALHRKLNRLLSAGPLHRLLVGGIFVCSESFFRFYLSFGGIRALGSREWRLLSGPELRSAHHQVQEAGFLHSLLREFFGSYTGAYSDLCAFCAHPRISVWLRLERRLMDVVAFAAGLSNPASAWREYTASRVGSFDAFGSERLASAAGVLRERVRERRLPSPRDAVSSFIGAATPSIEQILESPFCRPFFEALPQRTESGWARIWEGNFATQPLPQENWQTELHRHFESPDWMWLDPPLPHRLGDCAVFVRPMGAALLGARYPEYRWDLLRCECADYGALFSGSLRSELFPQFVRFGAYFALLEAVLRCSGSDSEELHNPDRIEPELRNALSPYLEPLGRSPRTGRWADIEKLAPLFLQAKERCMLLLESAEQV